MRGGAHVYLEHQVTIGAERGQSPRLGDNVFIGAGAKVVGPVTIGHNCRIGANAVVVHDIPSGSTAVGIPAKVVNSRNRSVLAKEKAQDQSEACSLLEPAATGSMEP